MPTCLCTCGKYECKYTLQRFELVEAPWLNLNNRIAYRCAPLKSLRILIDVNLHGPDL